MVKFGLENKIVVCIKHPYKFDENMNSQLLNDSEIEFLIKKFNESLKEKVIFQVDSKVYLP